MSLAQEHRFRLAQILCSYVETFVVFIVTEQKEIITQCTLNFICVHVWEHAYNGMYVEIIRQFV